MKLRNSIFIQVWTAAYLEVIFWDLDYKFGYNGALTSFLFYCLYVLIISRKIHAREVLWQFAAQEISDFAFGIN